MNGFMVGTYFSCEVCAGKRAVDCMVFSSTELDENDIENFETVEFSFHIFKTADRNTIDDSKPVVLNSTDSLGISTKKQDCRKH